MSFARRAAEAGRRLVNRSSKGHQPSPDKGPLRTARRRTPVTEGTISGTIAYTRSGGFLIPHASLRRPAAQAALRGRVWERKTVELLRELCDDRDVVHAGTYYGDFLPPLARATSGTVWAFEPNELNYRCAAVTAIINRLDNVRLHNAALSNEVSVAHLRTTDGQGRSLGGTSHLVAGPADTTIETTTIDSIVGDADVGVIQLDVEGHERQALEGAAETVDRCRPALVLETVPDDAWLAEHLAPLGYVVKQQVNANTLLLA
jgi:FkbM family methyltransferase